MANLNSFLDDAPESIRSNKEVIAWLSEKLETLESEKKIERLEAEIKKLKGSRSNEENLRKQANEWKAKYERLHRAATIPKHEHSEDNAKLIEKTRQQLLKQYDEEIGRRAENEQRQAQQVIEQAKKIERLQAENAKYRQVLEKAKKQDFHPSAPSKATSASGNVYNDLTGYKTKSLTVGNEKQNGTPNNSRRTCSSVSNDIQGNAHAHAAVKLAISTLDAELPESYTKNSIDVESLQLPRRRPGLKVPQFEGSCEVRLGQMIDWGTQSFPKRKAEVRYFNADTFIGAGVFYQLCRMDSCDQYSIRLFYLERLLEEWVREENESGTSKTSQNKLQSRTPPEIIAPAEPSSHPSVCGVAYRQVPCQGGEFVLLLPNPEQYRDLKERRKGSPLLFTVAEKLGARKQGAFVIEIPTASRPELPEQRPQQAQCTTYVPEKLDGFWRLFTKKEKSSLPLLPANPQKVGCLDAATKAYENLVAESFKQKKSLEGVAYQTDIPAETSNERDCAYLPPESPIWPIRGNKLPRTGIPGLHTPTCYRGTPFAPFAWHHEDFELGAINYLHYGQKIWFVTHPGFFDKATATFQEALNIDQDHSQFLRHEAVHGGVQYLRNKDIPTIGFMQEAGQIVVVYPRAYHSGFGATATVAEAVNYADLQYTLPQDYRPCHKKCQPSDPITADLVFPENNCGRTATLRCKPKTVATLCPAPTSQDLREGVPKRKYAPEPKRKPSERPRLKGKKHNEAQDEPSNEPPAKRQKDLPPLEDMANEVINAEERAKSHIMACIDNSDLILPNKTMEKKADQYLVLSARWAKHAPFSRMVALILETHAVELMYYESFGTLFDKNRVLRRLPSEIVDKSLDMLTERPTDSAFRTWLGRRRTFLKLGLEYLLFIPVAGEKRMPGFQDFERLTDHQIQSLRKLIKTPANADTIAKVGERFRRSIIEGDISVWKNIGHNEIRDMNLEEISRRIFPLETEQVER
ncbi:hypothetical protein M0657_011356 [Pyricularia oryzae]|nr:hypothetical protein M0657_011356 [Pyricularia oryzae]